MLSLVRLRSTVYQKYSSGRETRAGDSNDRIMAAPRAIAMAGGGVRDECVIYPNGIRDGGSESDTAMDDLKPDAQPWSSSFYRIPKVLEWT